MITQVDISNFGSFSDLDWRKTVRDNGGTVKSFQRLNILYGRNYSGKTTLSRIFRALETGKLPLNYIGSEFQITGSQGVINSNELQNSNYDVRVYNRDFVAENLGFLINQNIEGQIKTFAIVGDRNKEIDESIAAIETKLGSIENRSGLRFDLEKKKSDKDHSNSSHIKTLSALETKLRTHAAENIKKNPQYASPIYNIESIKQDIAAIKAADFSPLSLTDQATKVTLLRQEALPEIKERLSITLRYDLLRSRAEQLLAQTIKPTKPIQELLDDNLLGAWVKQGMTHHRDKRDSCAFCRQNLPHDIWKILDEHFNKETEDLDKNLDRALESVRAERVNITNLRILKNDVFYSEEALIFESTSSALREELELYLKDLDILEDQLAARKISIFQPLALPIPFHSFEKIQSLTQSINDLVVINNKKTSTLEQDKATARRSLRLTEVYKFADAIKYDTEINNIAALKFSADIASAVYSTTELEIREAELEIQSLRNQQKDERKAATRVNSLLNNFFGHDGLKLESRDTADLATVKFEITRDGKAAFNLSEGECSLIAFCYFMASLESLESAGKELIIYIDDPISSLDSNHIFFMYSLIESLITKPIRDGIGANTYRYKQLFISTHNLDFLKYLKRLSLPSKKVDNGSGKSKNAPDHEHFMVERNGGASNILLMPAYLRDYITEFHYLFHQIYKCKDQSSSSISHEPFFSFGNNLRKFLEAFLFFKYPYHDNKSDSLERVTKFFGAEDTAIALVNRITNEFSHAAEIPDRSFKPVDIPEIARVANYVLDKIYSTDAIQYNALLKSIGEPERATTDEDNIC